MQFILAATDWSGLIGAMIVLAMVVSSAYKALKQNGSGQSSDKRSTPPGTPRPSQTPAQSADQIVRRRQQQLEELARRRQQAMQQQQQQQPARPTSPTRPASPMQRQDAPGAKVPGAGGIGRLTPEQLRRLRLEQLRRQADAQAAQSLAESQAKRITAEAAAARQADQRRLEEIARRQDIATREAELERQRQQAMGQWETQEERRMAVVAGDPGNDQQVHRHVPDAKPDAPAGGLSHSQWIGRMGQMNRSTLQRAFVLKEVLDTPPGLRE